MKTCRDQMGLRQPAGPVAERAQRSISGLPALLLGAPFRALGSTLSLTKGIFLGGSFRLGTAADVGADDATTNASRTRIVKASARSLFPTHVV